MIIYISLSTTGRRFRASLQVLRPKNFELDISHGKFGQFYFGECWERDYQIVVN